MAHTLTRARLNQTPRNHKLEFFNMLGSSLLPARPSTTTLRFTKLADYLNVEVTVPAGISVTTRESDIIVLTDVDLIIPAGAMTGDVAATASEAGNKKAIAGAFNTALESLVGVETVTNTAPLTGGAEEETVEAAELRVRDEFEIGEHLGSAEDYRRHILFRVLGSHGRVTPFEGYLANFTPSQHNGCLLLVVQGEDGLAVGAETFAQINSVIAQRRVVGTQVVAAAPSFQPLALTIEVTVQPGLDPAPLIERAKQNLLETFHPLTYAYGPHHADRRIQIVDIIEQVGRANFAAISVRLVDGRPAVRITYKGVTQTTDAHLLIGELPTLAYEDITITRP
jgi:hypothetical protein